MEDKHQFWKQHLSDWKGSQLSQSAYCRQNGLVYHQWNYWKKKVVVEEMETMATRFVTVPLDPLGALDSETSGVSVVVGPFRVELGADFVPATLHRVVEVLRQIPCCQ